MYKKKHIVGIGASAAIFGVFGIFMMYWTATFGGVSPTDPMTGFATGQTTYPVTTFVEPFGLSPADIGLTTGDKLVLPAVPPTVTIAGVPFDLGMFTVAQFFGGGGALAGTIVGLYYATVISIEQRREQSDNTASD